MARYEEAERVANGAGAGAARAAVVLLAVLASLAALYAGSEFFVPLALAAVLAAPLRAPVRALARRGVPVPLGAALLVLGAVGAVGVGALALEPAVRRWLAEAPQTIATARAKLDRLRQPLARLTGGPQTGGAPQPGAPQPGAPQPGAPQPGAAPAAGAPPAAPRPGPPQEGGGIVGELPKLALRGVGTAAGVLTAAAEILLLLYFLLAGGDRYLRRFVDALRDPTATRTAVEVVRDAEAAVGRYLWVTLLINVGQGIVVALALWGIGMPRPALWGAATVVLEFLPFVGGLLMITMLAIVGLAAFDSPGRVLLAPALYLLASGIQNNVVSPVAYGRGLRLNPFAILVAVLFWGALWGFAGVFLAVPMAAALKALSDRVPALAPLGAFLED